MLSNRDFTVGNTVTIGIAIYKQNWRQYLKLSFVAHLWLLIPVYGWARYFAIAAWISRLSLQELDNELVYSDRQQYFSIRSLCIFSFTAMFAIFEPIVIGYLSFTILGVIMIVFGEVVFSWIFSFSLIEILENYLSNQKDPKYFFYELLGLVLLFLIFLWFYTRLFVTDLIFTDRSNSKLFDLICRSYSITKNNKLKTYITICLSCFLTLPVWIIGYLIALIIAWFILAISSSNLLEALTPWLSFCLVVTLVCAHGIVLPFWQSIKAVVFYHLSQRSKNY